MTVEDRIECPRCGRAVVPHLHFYDGSAVTFSRVQHICPFCGAVLFESGGGVRWGMVIPLLVTIGAGCLIFVYAVMRSGH